MHLKGLQKGMTLLSKFPFSMCYNFINIYSVYLFIIHWCLIKVTVNNITNQFRNLNPMFWKFRFSAQAIFISLIFKQIICSSWHRIEYNVCYVMVVTLFFTVDSMLEYNISWKFYLSLRNSFEPTGIERQEDPNC